MDDGHKNLASGILPNQNTKEEGLDPCLGEADPVAAFPVPVDGC
jgi:hypothetical protein